MTIQFARVPQQGKPSGPPLHAPHAALLIDFDNVTMGIRSDITKELKNLLNSDIIKGKVAVQRAYADWRRYPQYVVPLAEASVDLIFAPAYGSSKKNATDIRLSIDALELVFTRVEIGTFILLSGDSDFSSLVLKLKEYGKYVIGVGIRESASDLLVQNCDEYYSYSALTGLTRAGEEEPAANVDPWELVDMAVQQMVSNDDVMRSDRLKQVMIETNVGKVIADQLSGLGVAPVLLAFALALVVRVMQGSATVAMLTAAGLVVPLIEPTEPSAAMRALLVVPIAAGATCLSHVNDSGFGSSAATSGSAFKIRCAPGRRSPRSSR